MKRRTLLPLLALLLASCDDVFQTHPYDVNIKGETGINAKNIARVETAFADKDTLRVAFISDTHLWHSDARDEVADVNRRNVDFVVHCGDLTDTGTTKEFIPWNLPITGSHDGSATAWKHGWTLSPLTASLYVNAVYGHEFWKSQPSRYPDKYYEFMSTKFRLNVALGQRITWEIPSNRRKYAKSVTLFYEVSSCDLYIRAKFQDSSVPLKDILGLSISMKLQTL